MVCCDEGSKPENGTLKTRRQRVEMALFVHEWLCVICFMFSLACIQSYWQWCQYCSSCILVDVAQLQI